MENKILIDSVNNLKVALNEISVYDFDVYTSMELYYKIAENFNKVIKELNRFEGVISEEVVKQNEKLLYLLGEGLNQEVVKKINEMVDNGTFETIINHDIFNNLNFKLSEMDNKKTDKTETEKLKTQINNLVLVSDGTQNAEVVQARGGYDVLNDRLNASDSILEETKGLILYKNKYTSFNVFSTNGNQLNQNIYKDSEYINIDLRYDESSSTLVAFNGEYKVGEIEEVIITALSEVDTGYVSLGYAFNWGMMKKIDLIKNKETNIIIKPTEIPNSEDSTVFTVGFGSVSGDKTIGKIKYMIKYKTNTETKSDMSKYSELSEKSLNSKNSGGKYSSLDNIIPNNTGLLKTYNDDNEIILYNNLNNENNIYWGGYHIEIPYDNIGDLNVTFKLNYELIDGFECNQLHILKNITDWNPSVNPISLPIKYLNDNLNLYDKINESGFIEDFKSLNRLYILIGCSNSDGTLNTTPFTWKIKPLIEEKNSLVVATNYSNKLLNETKSIIVDTVRENINKIPIGINSIPINNYTVREDKEKYYSLTEMNHSWINIKKENTELGTKYGGIYAKFNYDNLNDLDGDFIVNYKYNSGLPVNNMYILYDMTDWGDSSFGVIGFQVNKVYNLKDLLSSNPTHDYQNRKHFYICVVHYNAYGVSGTIDFDIRVDFISKNNSLVIANNLNSDYKNKLVNEIIDKVNNDEKYISCWGDSLTAGGGWTETLGRLADMPVYNMGVGGESSYTIYTRQGANALMVDNLTIPSTGSVTLGKNFKTMLNYNDVQRPFRQGLANFNPCTIDGIEGNISFTGQWDSVNDDYIFTRLTDGEEKIINRPTAIIGKCDKYYNSPYLMIIFIGQNGGWSDLDDLVNQHRLMIEHSNAKNIIVLGLSSGSKLERADYESRMKKEFGRYFISLREYLSQYGLKDANIEPTETDIQMMSEGKTPQSLLADTVHYTPTCKTVIGNLIYKRCCELNIF